MILAIAVEQVLASQCHCYSVPRTHIGRLEKGSSQGPLGHDISRSEAGGDGAASSGVHLRVGASLLVGRDVLVREVHHANDKTDWHPSKETTTSLEIYP